MMTPSVAERRARRAGHEMLYAELLGPFCLHATVPGRVLVALVAIISRLAMLRSGP